MTPKVLVVALVAMATLAGCGAKGTADGSDSVSDVNVVATDTTGIIKGVVIDDAIKTVAGVRLTTQMDGRTLTTNSSSAGSFGFEGLKPGTYFVSAHKLGYLDVRNSVEVVAGVNDPPVAKVRMERDAAFVAPFAEPDAFEGFINCSAGAVGAAAAVCAIPNDMCLPDPVLGVLPCAAKGPHITNDLFSHYIPLDKGAPTYIQGEVIWDSTQAAGASFDIVVRSSSAASHADGFYIADIGSFDGGSPLLFTVDAKQIEKYDLGVNGTGLELDLFTGDGLCDPSGAVCPAGVTLNQDFKIITHMFYGFTPSEGYRFSVDGDPKPPQ